MEHASLFVMVTFHQAALPGQPTMLAQRPLCLGRPLLPLHAVSSTRVLAPACSVRIPGPRAPHTTRPLTMRVRSGPPAADAALGLGAAGDSASNGKSSVVRD